MVRTVKVAAGKAPIDTAAGSSLETSGTMNVRGWEGASPAIGTTAKLDHAADDFLAWQVPSE